MNLKEGSWGFLVETMLIRKSRIPSIRIALCDNLELPGTTAILEKRALLRVNFDHFYYILDFFSSFLRVPGRDYAHSKEYNSLYQNRLMGQPGITWNERNSRKKDASWW